MRLAASRCIGVALLALVAHCTATTTTGRKLGEAAPAPVAATASKPAVAASAPAAAVAAPASAPAAAASGASAAVAGGEAPKKHHKAEKGDAAEKKPEEKAVKAATKKSRQKKMPAWFIITLCVLALVVPVSIAVLLIAYKRRSEASGGTPGVVSTQEPMEEGFPDDEPDSPRAPDPFASAFASGGADDEDERRL